MRRKKRPSKLSNSSNNSLNGSALSCGRALVLAPHVKSRANGEVSARSPEARLAEAIGLARAIGLEIVDSDLIALSRARPGTLLGSGKVAAIAEQVARDHIDVAVVDGALTPVQQRNLERAWSCKVIDRTGLILEIFGARARTREGRAQVELAALTYQRSRLVRSWTHLERQRGGYGFLGGPGESQIEADRRHIGERITRIRRELKAVVKTRSLHRSERRKVPYPVVALVGYTNAGKSTLFNHLTGSHVFANDQLFATLDPTMRALSLPDGRPIILSDTVGFISDLPPGLVAAFSATLEEVRAADLIVHVCDISNPDAEAQKKDVVAVLSDLGVSEAAASACIEVFNKIDLVSRDERTRIANQAARHAHVAPVSAVTGEGCKRLLECIAARLSENRHIVDLSVAIDDGAAIAWLYRHGEVLSRADDAEFAHIRVGLDPADRGRFAAARANGESAHKPA